MLETIPTYERHNKLFHKREKRIYYCSLDIPASVTYNQRNIYRVFNFIETREIIKDSSVRMFIFLGRHKHIPHQWREKSNEIVISTNVDDQRMSLSCDFFLIFLIPPFDYHFFPSFSTVHLSFMKMAKRHKNFESHFLRHYVSSNHFFLYFFPSNYKKRNISYLFFLRWYDKLTDTQIRWYQSCWREILLDFRFCEHLKSRW